MPAAQRSVVGLVSRPSRGCSAPRDRGLEAHDICRWRHLRSTSRVPIRAAPSGRRRSVARSAVDARIRLARARLARSPRRSASARRRRACSSGAATETPGRAGVSRRRAAGPRPALLGDVEAGLPPHPQRDRGRHADLRPRRLRRRRHLCHRARGRSACASSAPTSAGTCRAASRRATASPAQTLARLAEEGYGLVLTVDCGITAVEEVAEAKAPRARGRSSPITTGRGRRSPTARSSPRGPPTTRSRSSAARASSSSSREALGGATPRAPPRPRRAGDDRRRRPAR